MCLCEHSEVVLMDHLENPIELPLSCILCHGNTGGTGPDPSAHKKHSHGHKGGSLRRATSKHCVTSPSQDQPGQKLYPDTAASALKQSKVEQKTKHIDESVFCCHRHTTTGAGWLGTAATIRFPSTAHTGPLIAPNAHGRMLLPLEGPSQQYEAPDIMQPPSPADELLLLSHSSMIRPP